MMGIELKLKTGFQALESMDLKEEYLRKLETSYSFELPSLFRKFIKNYSFKSSSSERILLESQEKNFLSNDFFIKELIKYEDYAAMAKYSGNFVMIGGIDFERTFSIDLLFQNFESDDFLEEERLLMFGAWGGGDSTLMVGYGKDNYDHIFIENNWFTGKPIRKIGESILDIVPYFKQYCFLPDLKLNELRKKEDENFWRQS